MPCSHSCIDFVFMYLCMHVCMIIKENERNGTRYPAYVDTNTKEETLLTSLDSMRFSSLRSSVTKYVKQEKFNTKRI